MTTWRGAVPSSLGASTLTRVLCLLCLALPAAADQVPLWRIEGGQSTVHILGSIHALTREHYPLPKEVMSVFDAADRVVFEIDMSRIDPQEMAALTQELGLYQPPATLESELSEETLAALNDFLAERGLSLQQVNRLKPWLLGLQISVQEIQRLGYNPALGLDAHLMQRALGDGKDIGQLETMREQMELLSVDPPAIQDLALRVAIEELEHYERELNRMMAAWSTADTEKLYAMAVESADRYPELEPQLDRIIHDRNVTMAADVRELLEGDTNALVVVGALHLGGPRGVLSLLSEDYDFEQVKTN